MKTKLTTEQSAHLIELGVPREKASLILPIASYEIEDILVTNGKPIFTLTNLLEILPKDIYTDRDYPFRIESWFVECAVVWDIQYVGIAESFIQNKELIDALYELVVWCIENGHLKFD